ncbi:MAG TPA: hypothetical protein VH437_15455 [Terriglobales bacterium]|jgi:hypothetical protein
MSEELIRNGENEEVEFEREDLSPRSVISFFVGLAVAGVLIYFVLTGIYKLLDAYEARNQPQQNPLAKTRRADTRTVTSGDVQQFPEPRLESNERTELNGFRLREEQTLNSYGWVDQKAGIVHIPIDRAMELIVERGLPTRPQAGTVPPSPVNTAREAAAKADRSQKAPAKPPNQ